MSRFRQDHDGPDEVPDVHIHVHIHNEPDPRIDQILLSLDTQTEQIYQLTKQEKQMATDLTTLTNEVTNNTDVVGSAITLLNGLAAELAAAGTDPVALQALADSLNANNSSLAAAVVANTPVAPPA